MTQLRTAQFIPGSDDVTDVFEVEAENGAEKTTQQRRLDDIVSDLTDSTDESELRVYRQTNGGKSAMRLLETFAVDKYSMTELWDYLRRTYGSGDYRIHVRQNGRLLANKLIEIEAPRAQTGPSQMGEMGQMLNAFLERQERQNQQMFEMLNHQQPSQSRMDMLQEMMLFKQLFDNGNKNGDAISQLKESIEVMQSLGVNIGGVGNDDNDTGFGGLLEKMVPVFEAAAKGQNSQQQPLKQNPDPRQQTVMMQNLAIKNGLSLMINAAKRNANPISYAEMVFDQVPENIIREYMTGPQAVEKLALVNPEVVQYRAWFIDLGEHIKAQLGMESKYAEDYATGDDDGLQVDDEDDITPETSTADAPTNDATDVSPQ